MKEEQLKLFDTPEKILSKKRGDMYRLEIIEEGGEIYVSWQRAYSKAQAMKVAAILYNKEKKFDEGNYIEFGKVEEKK